jgi:hypothetical protein
MRRSWVCSNALSCHTTIEILIQMCSLTLTEASRAYLMEPQWWALFTFHLCLTSLKSCNRNPTIEEQALARIHRIGQERKVTTVRFFIRNSFEERVIETQESKKNLASVLLLGHDGGQADNSLTALQVSARLESHISYLLTHIRGCVRFYSQIPKSSYSSRGVPTTSP